MIPADCSEAEWSFFTSKWTDYKSFYKLSAREDIFTELRGCCLTDLQYKLFTATLGTDQKMEEVELLKEIKRLAVMKVNTAVHVKEFLAMSQDSDEPVRKLYARLSPLMRLQGPGCGEVRQGGGLHPQRGHQLR